jgi:hypothetical protein
MAQSDSQELDWSKLTDRERKEIGENTYEDYSKGKPIKVNDGKTTIGWAVDDTGDSSGSGGQVTVVANDRDVPRLRAASKELKRTMARFPDAGVDVCGRSLGSVAGQRVLAATVFCGSVFF